MLKKGIILDAVAPKDFLKIHFGYCCEQCSFFNHFEEKCSLEHDTTLHLRRNQIKTYAKTGKMAFCRNHEID